MPFSLKLRTLLCRYTANKCSKDKNYLMPFMTIYTQKICTDSWNTYTFHFPLPLRGHLAPDPIYRDPNCSHTITNLKIHANTILQTIKLSRGPTSKNTFQTPNHLPINADFLSKCSDSDMPSAGALGLPDKSTNFAQSLFEK